MPVNHRKEQVEFARAVRDSSLKRLRMVPEGRENWAYQEGRMSLADLAQHLIDADRWLCQRLVKKEDFPAQGTAGVVKIEERHEYVDLLARLEESGNQRCELIANYPDDASFAIIPDQRFEEKMVGLVDSHARRPRPRNPS